MRSPRAATLVGPPRRVLVAMVAKVGRTCVILVHAILGSTRPNRLVGQQDEQHYDEPATHLCGNSRGKRVCAVKRCELEAAKLTGQ